MNGTTHSVRTESRPERRISGYMSFAAYLLIVVGLFHLIDGFVALFKSGVFLVGPNNLLVFDYTQWGWTHIILGILVMATGAALFSGRMWARITAIVLATLSAIANFGFIWAYPLWSITIIALDILVIYAVAMHAHDRDFEDYEIE